MQSNHILCFQRVKKTDENKLPTISPNDTPAEQKTLFFEDNVSFLTNEFEQ